MPLIRVVPTRALPGAPGVYALPPLRRGSIPGHDQVPSQGRDFFIVYICADNHATYGRKMP